MNHSQPAKQTADPAFDDLFRIHYSKLCMYSFKITKNFEESRDLVQDVFVKYWDVKDTLVINYSTKAYLYKSTYNASLNFLRSGKTRAKYVEYIKLTKSELSFENSLIEMELAEKINTEVGKLPDRTQRVFHLSRVEQLKYKEIAAQLDISIKTVEAHISKALKVLTLQLKEYIPLLAILIYEFYLK